MNRKVAVAAIVGGLMHAVSVLRGQEVQPAPVRVRPPVGELQLAPATVPLTSVVAEDLQRQINELTIRLNALAQAQANTVGFTKVGNDFEFAPASGNVSIKAPTTFTIQGGSDIRLFATGNIQQRGAAITLN
jgi:hypothetical protein